MQSLIRRAFYANKPNLMAWDKPYDVMQRLLAGHRVQGIIDAGASDGHVGRRLLQRFPQATVYAFEPHAGYEPALRQFAERDQRFRPFAMALGAESGKARLYQTKGRGATSLFHPNERNLALYPEGAQIDQEIAVETTTLDQWSAGLGDPPIEVMKFDIQGGELKALQGARRLLARSVLLVYAEVFFNPMYDGGALFGDVHLMLRESGFMLYDFYKPGYDPRGMLIWANAIFVHSSKLGL
jgi:FkbM family methyltransferase